MTGLSLLNALFFVFISFIRPVYTPLHLYSFILSSHSIPSFLSFCTAVCVRPSVGAGLAEQQSLRRHTRSLDTHCIQLSLHTQSISTHAQETHTHNPLLTDLTPTSTQTVWAPLHSVSSRQICTIYSKLFLAGLITERNSGSFLSSSPPLRKHKEKMISFQLDRAQGNFPAVFTHSVGPDSRVHMWRAEELSSGSIFATDVHELRCFFLCSCNGVLPKTVTLQERGEVFAWMKLLVWM